ncbi:hypothetical protein MKX01_016841, partial [Papaver californicum]
MGVDYYNILQVGKTAKDDDLTKSYRRLAMKSHILGDPKKILVYDQYGEEGLKGQVPPSNGPTIFRFNPRNAYDIFAYFSGSLDCLEVWEEVEVHLEEWEVELVVPGELNGSCNSNMLPCSLEDLYRGISRKMKISMEISYASG